MSAISADAMNSSVEEGVWRYARATRASLIVDGEEYFALIQQAMLKAHQRVFLIGWDFDTRIHLTLGRRWWQKGSKPGYPRRLGSFIPWLARHNRQLEIRILKWSFGVLAFATRGTMVFDLIRWAPHKRIDFKFDSAHPVGCSHHQKLVVIDERFAVCGGIDMTAGRWDTPEHLPEDKRRRGPGRAMHGPWHDMSMMMEGEIAVALADLGHARWEHAGGKKLPRCVPQNETAWPDELEAQFTDVEIGVARTRAEHGDSPQICEIEQLYARQIAGARQFIYIENQYFASRAVCEALAKRLAEPDPPEIVIVHPANADGFLEMLAMDTARAELVTAIKALDTDGRFNIYAPFAGEVPIYVHAKMMIVDDQMIRVGSANINNRSMGLDSECDVFIDCARPGNAHACDAIRAIRLSLLSEHCGIAAEEVAARIEQAGTMAAMIDALQGQPGCRLRPFHPTELSGIERVLAMRRTLDPERPDEIFSPTPQNRGLFRRGGLLAWARRRAERKAAKKNELRSR
ncbi:MAG: phospholipase D-like domain-containing protein [Alteraurantiacibacter sp.]